MKTELACIFFDFIRLLCGDIMVEHHLKGAKKMKNGNDAAPQAVISLIESRQNDGKQFMLLSVRINGARKSVIYVKQGEDENFCTVDLCAEDCRQLFEDICEYGASAEHLAYIIEDACRERYL